MKIGRNPFLLCNASPALLGSTVPLASGLFFASTTPQLSGGIFSLPKQKQKIMILNDKQDCIESIARILEQTAAWRRKTAAKYPDDNRNTKAAEMLDKLAIDAASLTDEQFTDLQPHFGWSSQIWRDGLVSAARMVGFAHRNTNLTSFVRTVVRQLPVSRVAA
jgi:hypothetical protein